MASLVYELQNCFAGSPEVKSSASLVTSQLVCLRPFGILNLLRYVQFGLFVTVVCSARLSFYYKHCGG